MTYTNKSRQDWFDALIAKGHSPHIDEFDGKLDIWVTSHEYHNGPGCDACGEMWCMHCKSTHAIEKCSKPILELTCVEIIQNHGDGL